MLGSWPVALVIIRIIIILLLFLQRKIITPRSSPGRERKTCNLPRAGPVFEWKGCQGHARKPHAERSRHGEHRTGEDVGAAAPLMPLERPKPPVWGAVEGSEAPRRLHP